MSHHGDIQRAESPSRGWRWPTWLILSVTVLALLLYGLGVDPLYTLLGPDSSCVTTKGGPEFPSITSCIGAGVVPDPGISLALIWLVAMVPLAILWLVTRPAYPAHRAG